MSTTTRRSRQQLTTAVPAQPTFVLFHHAGGASSVFHEWSGPLAHAGRVVTPDLPGRRYRVRENPVHSAHEAVRDLLRVLDDREVTPPYVLLGHSMGALLAYEVAAAWQARGLPEPMALYVSGSRSPRLYSGDGWWADFDDDALAAEAARWGGEVSTWGLLRNQRRIALLRADLDVCRSYRWTPRRRLACPIVALTGDDDPIATPQQMSGWGDYSTGSFTQRVVTGSHFFLYTEAGGAVRGMLRGHSVRSAHHRGEAS